MTGGSKIRIFKIDLYRDGGSIEFHVERNGLVKYVWLATPLRGEPRELRIDSKRIDKGAPETGQLLDEIDQWWNALSKRSRDRVTEFLANERRGTINEATVAMGNLIYVLMARDYIGKVYGGGGSRTGGALEGFDGMLRS